MIAGKLVEIHRYRELIPHYEAIREYLNKDKLGAMEIGRHPILKDDVYIMIQKYNTKPENELFWESHRKYIDLQIITKGQEYMGYADICDLSIEEDYDDDKDFIKYKNETKGSKILAEEGMFCVFFREDGHKPMWAADGIQEVRKVVIKIRAE